MTPSGTQVIAEVARFLATHAHQHVTAAFIYGSVATGHARPGSDIDCFLLLTRELEPAPGERLRSGFTLLQQRLGYVPDPRHPVELFTEKRCRAALEGQVVVRAVDQARQNRHVGRELVEADDLEILRALLAPRLPVRGSATLDGLTDTARQTLTAALETTSAVERAIVLRVLGIRTGGSRGRDREGR
jgi:predicted nucleotidyltransferase